MTSCHHQLRFFWKGTAFPQIHNHPTKEEMDNYYKSVTELGNEMIKEGLKINMSIPQQIKDYTEQLNAIELFLSSLSCPCSSRCSCRKKIHKEFKKSLGTFSISDTLTKLQIIWELNVLALLKMGAIHNDNMYGLQFLNFI